MSEVTLLEIARQRRLEALASLDRRKDNLFSLAEYRIRARANAGADRPVAVFRSARVVNDNLFASVAPDDRMAA
jgi:hypothetical protein